jgi:hypothetical protein
VPESHGKISRANALDVFPISGESKSSMGKQYNKEIKKRRRLARLKRKKLARQEKK